MHPESHEPAGSPGARIPARSRAQAMDLSLVLASQGIEHSIDNTNEAGWALLLAAADYAPAHAAIRQSRLENRHWRWRTTIPYGGAIFDGAAIGWVLLMIGFYCVSVVHPNLRLIGVMDSTALARGEWWRLFTATLLHADLGHLATNALFGFLLLGLAMGRYGTGVGLLAAFLAGVVGNVASGNLHESPFQGLGASGVVMGALGLLTVQSFGLLRNHPNRLKMTFGSIAGGVLLFVLLGFSPNSDVIAHGGGFLAGIGLGFLLGSTSSQRHWLNRASGIGFAGLIIWTWTLALRSAG